MNAEAAAPRFPGARGALPSPLSLGPAGRGRQGQRSQAALPGALRPQAVRGADGGGDALDSQVSTSAAPQRVGSIFLSNPFSSPSV